MKRILAYLLISSGLILRVADIHAQEPDKVNVRTYTTENGLPSNGVKGLQWDEKSGFLWIATEAGIVRFNGVDFRSFTKENMPEIASERMVFMTRNKRGHIYITDLKGNIFSPDQSRPRLWWRPEQLTNPYFDNYYLLSVSDTFFRRQVYKNTTPVISALTEQVCAISDTACMIIRGGNLYYNSISKLQAELIPSGDEPWLSIAQTGTGIFLQSRNHLLYRLDVNGNSIRTVRVEYSPGVPIDSPTAHIFWEMGMDSPILIDKDKAWVLDFHMNMITGTLIFTGIPSDALIRTVRYVPDYKMLFLGTDSKGLLVLQQNLVVPMKRSDKDSKNRNSYYAQIELKGGGVLTNEGDIIGRSDTASVQKPIKGKFLFNVVRTTDSLLWYSQNFAPGNGTCLYRYDYRNGQTTAFPKIHQGELVTGSGKRFYLVNQFGIGWLDGDSMRYRLGPFPNRSGNILYDFKEVSPGVLGIATCGGYLEYHINENRIDTIFRDENICVRTIWRYGNYIFLGTYGSGYFVIRNGSAVPMPVDKNKYLLYTHCFVTDNNGFCWISTNRGLFKVKLSDMLDAASGRVNSIYYHYFGKNDGMEMTELNGGCTPCALRMQNETISFPTMDGLLWVNPEKASPVLPDGSVFVDEILVDNKPMDPVRFSASPLAPGPHDVVFNLTFTAWCNKENIYLEYQLNDSTSWTPVQLNNESEIRLNHLPPGEYSLLIRKRNGFGATNYSYKKITFSISIPWYSKWWFFLLCVLGGSGIIFMLIQLRTRRYRLNQLKLEKQIDEKTRELKEKNDVLEKSDSLKTKLISIISHDIVTPLKFITVAGMNLREKRSQIPTDLQDETIREIANTSQELQLLSTNILNWIKYQHENRRLTKEAFLFHDLVQQVFGVLASLARQKNIRLANLSDPSLTIYQFYEPLKILVYNLVLNAINFSEAGTVEVSCESQGRQAVIRVKDGGVGMTSEQIHNLLAEQIVISSANIDKRKGNGLGYLIIKDLVKTTGSSLDIKSEKGQGTTVIITVPVQKPGA